MVGDKVTYAAFVGVGSNIEPESNIASALQLLKQRVTVVASSTFYRTRAIGGGDQADFINGVWRIETTLAAAAVKRELLRPVEDGIGRRKTVEKHGCRTIDLDLLLYGDMVIDSEDLTLPHRDLGRSFVYGPVVELLAEMPGESAEPMMRLVRGFDCSCDPGRELAEFTDTLRRLLSDRSVVL